MLSPDVAEFLIDLLSSLTISAGEPGFEETAALVGRAKREVAAALPPPAPAPNRQARRAAGKKKQGVKAPTP